MTDPDGRLPCATYTHARRHPMVLGKLGNWAPPFQVTFPQLTVVLGVLLVEYLTWRLWAPRLPVAMAVVVFIGLPCGLAWAARRARIEGRSLVRAARGGLSYLALAGRGRAQGRHYRPQRAVTLDDAWVYLDRHPVPAGGPGPAGVAGGGR